ncbi:MAG: flagellar filament capping protein FliD [Rickettsiales bacterium]|nr:flagellar filament capping protein FliD [Rickettsiales bacterium]
MVTEIRLGNLFTSGGKNVITGGASGIDIEGLVKGLTEARAQPAVALQDKIDNNTKRTSAVSELKKLVEDFKDAANFLRNPPGVQNASANVFRFRQAEVTANSGVSGSLYLNVTAEPGAPVGDYAIKVDSLATRNIQTTDTFIATGLSDDFVGEPGSAINAGILTVGAGARATAVTLANGDSLNDIISKVNAVRTRSGVEASLLQINSTEYRISFKSIDTGTNQNYNLATSSPGIFNVPFAVQNNAVDAQLTIDGTTITRQNNSIDDLIDGLTFNLVATTPVATTLDVSVESDRELAKSGITNFVDAYNAFKLFASRQTELGSDGRPLETSILASKSVLTTPLNNIGSEIAKSVEGLAAADPKALADIGITFADFPGDDETPFTRNILQIDEEKLESALQSDFDSVRRIFEFEVTSNDPNVSVFSRTNALSVSNFTLNVNTGTNTFQATYTQGGISTTVNLTKTDLGGTISLSGQSGTALQGLVLLYTGSGNTTANVNISQGLGDRLYNTADNLLRDQTGIISATLQQITDESSRYEEEITKINDSVERYRESLLAKYSQLEQTISQINTLLQSLDANTNAQNNN